jgi:hypothetical protein
VADELNLKVTPSHPMYAYFKAQAEASREVVTPTFYPYGETARWCVGVDLGQAADFTAVAILCHQHGIIDARNSFERKHFPLDFDKAQKAERCDVRHLQRLPLGTSYPRIVEHVRELLSRPPLQESAPRLVIDETGVGKAVGDIFEREGMKPLRLCITGATVAETVWQSETRVHVSKQGLISVVDAGLHVGTLRFAAQLAEAETMKNELLDFRRQLTAQGRSIFGARANKHDDLVLAVAIAAWWLAQPPPARVQLGGY